MNAEETRTEDHEEPKKKTPSCSNCAYYHHGGTGVYTVKDGQAKGMAGIPTGFCQKNPPFVTVVLVDGAPTIFGGQPPFHPDGLCGDHPAIVGIEQRNSTSIQMGSIAQAFEPLLSAIMSGKIKL